MNWGESTNVLSSCGDAYNEQLNARATQSNVASEWWQGRKHMSLSERAKGPYNWFKQRESELQREAANNGDRLNRHNLWRYAYYKYPYLLLQSDDVIMERFIDVFSNCIDISEEGKIIPTPMIEDNGRFARLFTELIEETNWRGILTKDSIAKATEQIRSYYVDGTPPGAMMFRDKIEVKGQWLLKFSKKEFVDDMFKYGRFRISPASYYANGHHIRAVKDLETARNYKLKALSEVLEGKAEIIISGNKIPIIDGVVPLQFMLGDYYLFSTCKEINRRMPTDFEADAVLVIKDKSAFIQRLRDVLLEKLPGWEFAEGEVYYFDPFNDVPKDKNQEFWKHIGFSYQREHRCVLRPGMQQSEYDVLKPFFVEIGALDDLSEIVTL